MKRIKSFSEFVNETFLENPADADLLNHNKKKMKKNGYVEAEVVKPVDGLKKGDKITCSFTYNKGGLQYDSSQMTYIAGSA